MAYSVFQVNVPSRKYCSRTATAVQGPLSHSVCVRQEENVVLLYFRFLFLRVVHSQHEEEGEDQETDAH